MTRFIERSDRRQRLLLPDCVDDYDAVAARLASNALEEARARRGVPQGPRTIILGRHDPGAVNWATEPLSMARKQNRFRESVRMVLEPWVVEEALARLDR